jgi:membrane fusion protein (multidrug efflux system)
VTVSRTVGNQWLVDSGLASGDRLIVEGLQKVQPGMTVTAVEAPPAATVAADPQHADGAGTADAKAAAAGAAH